MSREFFRNVALFVELLAIGPLVSMLVTFLHGADGGPVISPLVNASPLLGAGIMCLILLAALLVGIADARFFGPRSGLAAAGFILGWSGWRTGEIGSLLRTGGHPEVPLAIEGLVIGAAALYIVREIALVGSIFMPSPAHHSQGSANASQVDHRIKYFAVGGIWGSLVVGSMVRPALAHRPGSAGDLGLRESLANISPALHFRTFLRPTSMLAIGAATIAAGLVAWLMAFHGAKGQTLFAAFLGGIAAGAAAAIVSAGSSDSQDDVPADPVLSASLGMVLLAVIAPLAAVIIHGVPGSKALDSAIMTGNLFHLSHIGALDWAFGALMGVPVGLGWAGAHAQITTEDSSPAAA